MKDRNRTAAVLAAIALLGALGIGAARNAKTAAAADDPPSAVYAMLEAARNGDVALYLEHFTAPELDGLRQTIRENGEPAFSKYLRESNASTEGVAAGDPEISDGIAKVRVEYVYRDRTAVQHLYLTHAGGRWQITRSENEEAARMPVPFGTAMK